MLLPGKEVMCIRGKLRDRTQRSTCAAGMFVHTLLGICVCVALCVCQNADSISGAKQHTPEQQDPITRKQTYVHVNNRLGVFIAAAFGTITLIGVIYCIYNQFYTKHPYTHTQLQETDSSVDMSGLTPPVFSSCGRMEGWMVRGGGVSYGSLADSPSIITLPPALSPPPLASPFPPPRPPRPASLRTISAQELQKNCL